MAAKVQQINRVGKVKKSFEREVLEEDSADRFADQSMMSLTVSPQPPSLRLHRSDLGGRRTHRARSGSENSAGEIPSSNAGDRGVEAARMEVGLENLGNTCFMNAALQCLLHIEPLVAFFLQGNIEEHLNLASPKKGNLALSFAQLVRDVYRQRAHSSVSPTSLQRAVCVHAPYLMDLQQQDSQEFLRFLLDGIAEDLCRKHSNRDAGAAQGQASRRGGGVLLPMLPQISPTTKVAGGGKGAVGGAEGFAEGDLESSVSSMAAQPSSSPQPQARLTLSQPATTLTSRTLPRSHTQRLREEALSLRDASPEASSALPPLRSSNQEAGDWETGRGALGRGVPQRERSRRVDAVLRGADEAVALSDSEQETAAEGAGGRRQPQGRAAGQGTARGAAGAIGVGGTADPFPGATPAQRRVLLAQKESTEQWVRYLRLNDSVITDMFAGQLQSTVECLTCGHRSSTYDPFLDLSVPIYRDSDANQAKGFLGSLRHSVAGAGDGKSTLEKCLEKFTMGEVLDNDNMYLCEKCSTKRKSIKTLSIYKTPQLLVVHIKRFRYSSSKSRGSCRDSTDVHFPMEGLDLEPYVSADLPPRALEGGGGRPAPVYDLVGVCNHHGGINSGHYIAHADTSGGGSQQRRWMCFNDSRVSIANPSQIAGPTAYVLFYKMR
ncbi:hypothetical protein B484DRAFT_456427 [Ochromonadaceae sp. CCMP2298]|nr:hypothetical protein B484DRAFT_456427 [Ochromonadaceae sp. CCMP2298]|mmetsp:Transcript_28466/g.63067  ORF Transcript_28466/g.63067 Transcript_28466/m.63067 type:complete len:663 (+) Transcript_28466:110-2098(+)